MLEAYWDKMINHIGKIALKRKDAHVKRVINKIIKVPNKIRYEVLRRFVQACRWVYAISFFQWRYFNPNTLKETVRYHDKDDDLLELIPCYIKQICTIPFEPQILRGKLGGKFLKKYKLLDPEVRPYLINSFRLIGWPDPFPKGRLMMNNEADLKLNKSIA